MEGERPDVSLGNVDSINNIETARMALRWALERLRALESAKAESGERSTREAKWRVQAEEEVRRLKATLAVKSTHHEERERYYKKIEEFLSLRLAGQVDIAGLAHKAAEVDALRADLEGRLGQLEREFSGRRQTLELEYQRLNRDAREAAQSGAQEAQAWLHKRQEEWEKDHASKLVDVKERELRVAKQETELALRQQRFDEYASAQKARLDAQTRELEEQAQARLRIAERLLEERQSAQESGWTREKALLLQEIVLLRRKTQELNPALLEADRRAEEASEALARAQEAQRRAEQRLRLSELDRGTDVDRRAELEAQLECEFQRRTELERRLTEALAAARSAQALIAEERLALADQEQALAREREAFRVAELEKDAPQRLAELRREFEARLSAAAAAREREAESLLRSIREREERVAGLVVKHDRTLEEQRARLASEAEARAREREDQSAAWEKTRLEEAAHWRRRLEEATGRIAELEGQVAEAEARATLAEEKAKAETERRAEISEHDALAQGFLRQEWDSERKALIGKLASLEEALGRVRGEGEAELRRLTAASEAERLQREEAHRREVEAARASQATWDETHVREAAEWRRRAEEAASHVVELEGRLAAAELAQRHAQQVEGEAQRRVQQAELRSDENIERMSADRQKERQDFERLLSERDNNEAKLHEEIRVVKLQLEEAERRLNDTQEEHRLRLKQELDQSWKARLSAEEGLAEKARGALERISELERILTDNDVIVRRAQVALTDDAERHKRLQQEAAESKARLEAENAELQRGLEQLESTTRRSLEEREAALYGQLAEREAALARRTQEVEAAMARASADYRQRQGELERLKVEVERSVTELIKRAKS